jgi:glycosyltransferase involved in cell wall biosynthesis
VRVGLDLLYLRPGATGGTETYARELAPRLAAAGIELTAFLPREAAEADVAPGAETVVLPARSRNRWQWVLAEQLLLPRAARRAGCQVVHGLAGTVPLRGSFARVVTVHDVLFATHPETTGRLRAAGFGAIVRAAVRTSDLVLVDTVHGATSLRRAVVGRAPIEPVPLGVAGPAVSPAPEPVVRDTLKLGDRAVLLCTSGRLPHKNVSGLLDAMPRLHSPRPVLVVTGYPTSHDAALLMTANELGVSDDVRLTGWLDPPMLEGLYAIASACVVASLDEGFGQPLLEAMIRGVPVAHSGGGALAEVAGDAGLRFAPHNPADIAARLDAILTDARLRAQLVKAGLARAAAFPWDATAQLTVAAYRRAIDARAGR